MNGFGARLVSALADRLPFCAGIDPHTSLLQAWGLTDDVDGLDTFARTTVEALAGQVAVLKPQSAFFERFGSAGVAVLERTVADARAMGALVVLDAKRGDIGSTAAAYARAYLDPDGPCFADALTVSPYLGFGSLQPFLDAAARSGSGVFVLAETSNPEGSAVQRAIAVSGRTVAQEMVDHAAACNAGVQPLGDVGVVFGATVRSGGADLSRLNGPVLAPGFGAQGATAADLGRLFGAGTVVLPSSSRDVLGAGPDPQALLARARSFAAECREAVRSGPPPLHPSGSRPDHG